MSRLLLICFVFMSSLVSAQIGHDPVLFHEDGLPVVVPAKAPTNYNERRDRPVTMPRYEIPGTFRNADYNGLGERTEETATSGLEYSPLIPFRDTVRVYVLDDQGNPVQHATDYFPEPNPGEVHPRQQAPETKTEWDEALLHRDDEEVREAEPNPINRTEEDGSISTNPQEH